MKNRKLLRAAAALLLVGVVGVASVGCSFELEQPEWVTQAICDHVFDEEEVLKEATCTEDGKIQKTCSDCGKTKITTVKATGHDVVEDEAVDATCTTPGLTAGSHCTACGEVFVKQEEVPAGHTYGEWTVDVAATCTTEGQQKRVCSVCGESETEAIPSAHIDAANDGKCDVCEGSIFENATYASVSEGDAVGGWYRIKSDGAGEIFTIIFDNGTCVDYPDSVYTGEFSVALKNLAGWGVDIDLVEVSIDYFWTEDATNGSSIRWKGVVQTDDYFYFWMDDSNDINIGATSNRWGMLVIPNWFWSGENLNKLEKVIL